MRMLDHESNTKRWARLALKAGLLLTDSKLWAMMSDRLNERVDDVNDTVKENYREVSNRVQAASRAVRGRDNEWLAPTVSFLGGVSLGIGAALLFAPASGEETRSAIRDKAADFGNRVRERAREASWSVSRMPAPSTGTEGQ